MSDADWLTTFTPRPLHVYVEEAVTQFGDGPAMDFLGRKWSWRELGQLVDKAAAGFQALGVRPRCPCPGSACPIRPYYTVCYFAVLKAGGTVVNFNPLYVEREIAGQVADSQTRIMVTLDLKDLYDKIETVRADGGLERIIVCPLADILPGLKKTLVQVFSRVRNARPCRRTTRIFFTPTFWPRAARSRLSSFDPATQVAVLQYTGGTTGIPKGAMLTHRNLSANLEQVRVHFASAKSGEERMLCVIPFFHVFAMTVAQNMSIMIGAEMVHLPRFELKLLLKTVARTKPSLFPGVPTIFTAINNARETASHDLSSIRLCISGGAPLPAEVRERFRIADRMPAGRRLWS